MSRKVNILLTIRNVKVVNIFNISQKLYNSVYILIYSNVVIGGSQYEKETVEMDRHLDIRVHGIFVHTVEGGDGYGCARR